MKQVLLAVIVLVASTALAEDNMPFTAWGKAVHTIGADIEGVQKGLIAVSATYCTYLADGMAKGHNEGDFDALHHWAKAFHEQCLHFLTPNAP